MSKMFYNCTSLVSFPDISKWNTKNVEKIDDIFTGCSCLNFPDISKWNLNKIKNKKILENDINSSDSHFELSSNNNSILSDSDSSNKNNNNNFSYILKNNIFDHNNQNNKSLDNYYEN